MRQSNQCIFHPRNSCAAVQQPTNRQNAEARRDGFSIFTEGLGREKVGRALQDSKRFRKTRCGSTGTSGKDRMRRFGARSRSV